MTTSCTSLSVDGTRLTGDRKAEGAMESSRFFSLGRLFSYGGSSLALASRLGVLVRGTFSRAQDAVLRRLLVDHRWVDDPKSFSSKLHFLAVKALSVGKNALWDFQGALPSLPVPSLDATCLGYLETVRPLISAEEFKDTEAAVREFLVAEGPVLQQQLLAYAQDKRNWLAQWWEDLAYLYNREPLVTSTDWYGSDAIARVESEGTNPQLDRASKYVASMLQFFEKIKDQSLEVVKVKGTIPVCMAQYERLYGTVRIPGEAKDTLEFHPDSRHIVVLCKNHCYRVDVYDMQGKALGPVAIKRQLNSVMADAAAAQGDGPAVGMLTTLNRTEWAAERGNLADVSDKNRASLQNIESSLFAIALENTSPETLDDLERNALVGVENRWFDLGMTFAVHKNGKVGSHVEHSWGDATIAASLQDYVITHEKYWKGSDAGVGQVMAKLQRLDFDVTPQLQQKIEDARMKITKATADYDFKALDFTEFGKRAVKKVGVSPDAFLQMAMQLAFYKMHKETVLTYETAATRLFYHGRTETVRVASNQSKSFVEAMTDDTVDAATRRTLLHQAAEAHVEYVRKASTGRGVDRHLMALRVIASMAGVQPKIFADKAFQLQFRLATSQTPCPHSYGGGFAPLTHDGYGIFYVSNPNRFVFHVNSKHSCDATSSARLGELIKESLVEMRDLLADA